MIKQLLKKVLIIYLVVIACVFTPTYRAYAASPSGFSFSKYDIIASAITAIKNSVSVKANFTPPPSTVIKFMGSAAIAYAVAKYGGQAIDWVMSADAQSVSRNKKVDGMLYTIGGDCSKSGATAQAACDVINNLNHTSAYKASSSGTSCSDGLSSFPIKYQMCSTTVKDTHQVTEFVPDVIADAKNGVPAAVEIVNNAVRDAFNSGLADPALTQAYDAAKAENEAHNCGSGTHWSGSACVADTPATPSTPTTDTPFDPSSIIDAINSVFDAITNLFDAVMSIPDVINTAIDDLLVDIKDFFQPVIDLVTDFIDWFKDTATAWKDDFVDEYKAFRDWVKSEPTPESPTKPDVTTLPTPPTDSVNISFGGGCPAPKVVPWSFAGRNIDITIPYTPICDTATLLNPLIKLAASLGAVFIIAGIRRGDDG